MKKMAWLAAGAGDGEKILHILIDGVWKPYSQCPGLRSPDYFMPLNHGALSKGFATMQSLLRQGYELVPSSQAIRPEPVAICSECPEINEWG